MISNGRNAFQRHVMHAYQGQVYAFSSKSHVQTGGESHDLNMDFAASNSFAYRIPMQEYLFYPLVNFLEF